MQDAELLVALAGIAGVFVGFGALISTTRGGVSEGFELVYIRGIMSWGLVVIVAALVPVVTSRYGIAGHELWLLSSLVFLLLVCFMSVVSSRTSEHNALLAAQWRASRMRFARFAVPPLLLEVSLLIALVLVVLGPVTDFEPALYITAVVLLLFEDALYLAQLVYSQGPPTA